MEVEEELPVKSVVNNYPYIFTTHHCDIFANVLYVCAYSKVGDFTAEIHMRRPPKGNGDLGDKNNSGEVDIGFKEGKMSKYLLKYPKYLAHKPYGKGIWIVGNKIGFYRWRPYG